MAPVRAILADMVANGLNHLASLAINKHTLAGAKANYRAFVAIIRQAEQS